jgi:hypothetical protein
MPSRPMLSHKANVSPHGIAAAIGVQMRGIISIAAIESPLHTNAEVIRN